MGDEDAVTAVAARPFRASLAPQIRPSPSGYRAGGRRAVHAAESTCAGPQGRDPASRTQTRRVAHRPTPRPLTLSGSGGRRRRYAAAVLETITAAAAGPVTQ